SSAVRSSYGDLEWPAPKKNKPGVWVKHKGDVVICYSGLHASPNVYRALSNRQGHRLGKIEARDIVVREEGKYAAREMRILALYSRKHVVGLALLAAAQALPIFEKKYPKDDRPRAALLAIVEYLR